MERLLLPCGSLPARLPGMPTFPPRVLRLPAGRYIQGAPLLGPGTWQQRVVGAGYKQVGGKGGGRRGWMGIQLLGGACIARGHSLTLRAHPRRALLSTACAGVRRRHGLG